ncbi:MULTISPECIES: NUDIX domain-containing protein [unclassified Zunongwangia]|uniref:NUDIX domain-containing protein n=1 Tax=unclassified Zunongwangia TaxID=2632541 RepID=UPI0022DDA496|nr:MULTISPECIES: NUDIX domain-containing protein [unclassified Zunongwangia]WBL23457.1 NUDIX domain-containing protein [Zunongwangia sp. HRR-M8]WBL24598.1 NUDIX domain-containing protein [Zunongwangia sp. HGR-M22]
MKKIEIIEKKVLSNEWAILNEYVYSFERKDGTRQIHNREVYDKGDGSAIILYNLETKKIILTRQFRIPTYVNGNEDGYLIEACAGLLDGLTPEECIVKETEEETGYRIKTPKRLFHSYMVAGAVTEIIYFFVAPYDESMKIGKGGGLASEGEEIEIIEIDFEEAYEMIATGKIVDAKTIILLQHMKINKIM